MIWENRTPWRVTKDGAIEDEEKNEVVGVGEVSPHDAKLIVRAVNAHDALLDELIKTNLFLIHVVANLPMPPGSPVRDLLNGHIELNAAAIALAK